MGLEVATWISQLVATNPLAGDKKNQGDDHFRLLKAVLQATFPNANRAYRFRTLSAKTSSGNIVEADDNSLLYCDASGGAFTLTLPTPSYAGWSVSIVLRTFEGNPVFVAPPSGTIRTPFGSAALIRCNVPCIKYEFVWSGSQFSRMSTGETAPGTIEYFAGPTLPPGYSVAAGQTLPRSDYPELFFAWGTQHGAPTGSTFSAPELRDRFIVGAGGTYALGDVGGAAANILAQSQLPNYTLPNTLGLDEHGGHQHVTLKSTLAPLSGGAQSVATVDPGGSAIGSGLATTGITITGGVQSGGSGEAIENRPPYMALHPAFRLC